jgi:uncharacterized alpha-E superfamily protein
MLDEMNPRSLLFQFRQLTKHMERLPAESTALPTGAQRILIEAVARLRLTDPMELSQGGAGVAETLAHLEQAMPKLSDALAINYFAHSAISRAGSSGGESA